LLNIILFYYYAIGDSVKSFLSQPQPKCKMFDGF